MDTNFDLFSELKNSIPLTGYNKYIVSAKSLGTPTDL